MSAGTAGGLLWLALVAALPAQGAGTETLAITTRSGVVQYFEIELAATDAARQRGLMFRRALPARRGMLFDFGRPQPVRMWMVNTLIPLDMLFIHADGTIESIVTGTEPGSSRLIESGRPVPAVLELNAGTAAQLDLAPGDRVRHRLFGAGPRLSAARADRR